ncbi:MAG: hypothetical protein FWF87_03935 [Synergistaceae bacterium]|nr:hypothetical protein [Synergistaceae bacterium]
MKKTFYLVVTIIIMTLSFSSRVWAAQGDSLDNPIIISTANDLDYVRNGLNKHYKLNNDIDLTNYLAPGGAGYARLGVQGWLPIGKNNNRFTGSFNGNGHVIKGLWIDRNLDYVGLFGCTENATFNNLGIEIAAAGIRGFSYVGGLVGLQGGNNSVNTITNCYTTGNITGDSFVGGLVGHQFSDSEENDFTIESCYTTGNIIANSYAGGLVGDSGVAFTISNCYATGDVTATDCYAGGLVGNQHGSGIKTITICYATGNITATNGYAGGLVGSNRNRNSNVNSISYSYAIGNVNGKIHVGGIVGLLGGGVYAETYCYEGAKLNGVVLAERNYHSVKSLTEFMTRSTYEKNSWRFAPSGPWHWDDRGFPKLNIGKENFPFPSVDSASFFSDYNISSFYGDGTLNNPYIITTAAELDSVRSGLDKHYKLSNNIDLTDYLSSGGAGFDKWGVQGWLPIGNKANRFTGSFNGNGHVIKGLWNNWSNRDYVGLFGYTENTTIRNLGVEIAAAGVKGLSCVGGLMGCQGASGGISIINNCYVTGDVTATNDTVGGLAGTQYISYYDSGANYMAYCYSTGNIRGTDSVGGLVGFQSCYAKNSTNTIENCYTTGKATATDRAAGGLVGGQFSQGGTSTIANCYATSYVSGIMRVGGLAAYQSSNIDGISTIENCYATGDVRGSYYVGGLIGEHSTQSGVCAIINSYSTGNINGGSDVGGLAAQGLHINGRDVSTITNCYRYEGATVNGAVYTENTPNGIHGGKKTMAELMTRSTYTRNGWLFSDSTPIAGPWFWDKRGFPKLNLGTESFPFPASR